MEKRQQDKEKPLIGHIKAKLKERISMQLPGTLLDDFLSDMTEQVLPTYGVVTQQGEIDPNLYLCKEGLLRLVVVDGDKQLTHCFVREGYFVLSSQSYLYGLPSIFKLEACCRGTSVLKLSADRLKYYIENYPLFDRWILSVFLRQLAEHERMLSLSIGDAKTKLQSLMEKCPEIINHVPLGIVASYLGITQQYLSSLRKQLLQ